MVVHHAKGQERERKRGENDEADEGARGVHVESTTQGRMGLIQRSLSFIMGKLVAEVVIVAFFCGEDVAL